MIKMLKYNGYEDDGVEGYQCLNCHNHIDMRHHAFSITIDYCPFCGCKFEGGFIKDNKYKFYKKDTDGYFRSVLYRMREKEYKQMWLIEKCTTTYYNFDYENDVIRNKTWEEVYTWNFNYDTTKSKRENLLLQLKQDMQNEINEKFTFAHKEIIEYRLKYCKCYLTGLNEDRYKDSKYYYPKNNKVIKTNKKKKAI